MIVVVEKELNDDINELGTINIWGELSDEPNATRTLSSTSETPTIGRSDAAKIRKDAEGAIANEEKNDIGSKLFRTAEGEVYGFVKDGVIYLDPKLADAETAIHEYGHLWGEALRAKNPAAWARLRGEMEAAVFVQTAGGGGLYLWLCAVFANFVG